MIYTLEWVGKEAGAIASYWNGSDETSCSHGVLAYMSKENERVIITETVLAEKQSWWKPNEVEYVKYYLQVNEDGYIVYKKV